jgi:hypothetical protein
MSHDEGCTEGKASLIHSAVLRVQNHVEQLEGLVCKICEPEKAMAETDGPRAHAPCLAALLADLPATLDTICTRLDKVEGELNNALF